MDTPRSRGTRRIDFQCQRPWLSQCALALFFAALSTFAVVPVRAAERPGPGKPAGWPEQEKSSIDEHGFHQGSPQPSERFQKSPEAQAVHEVAQLTLQAARAFDRGEDERARAHARLAAEKLESLERKAGERGNRKARSRFAAHRARLHAEFLGDAEAAKEAYWVALAEDPGNAEAERGLRKILDREEATAATEVKTTGRQN